MLPGRTDTDKFQKPVMILATVNEFLRGHFNTKIDNFP